MAENAQEIVKTYVYFGIDPKTQLIKIGLSSDPVNRAEGLRIRLLGVQAGGRELEAALHERFSHLRAESGNATKEWFLSEDSLLEYISSNVTSSPEKATVQFSVQLSEELARWVRIAAATKGIRPKEVVQKALEAMKAKEK